MPTKKLYSKGQLRLQILRVLEDEPETRNCDILLTIKIWVRFYPGLIDKNSDGKWAVRLKNIFELPREDNIKRIRAKIQNEEWKFLPTRWEVAKRRKLEEDRWRVELGYEPRMTSPTPTQ